MRNPAKTLKLNGRATRFIQFERFSNYADRIGFVVGARRLAQAKPAAHAYWRARAICVIDAGPLAGPMPQNAVENYCFCVVVSGIL